MKFQDTYRKPMPWLISGNKDVRYYLNNCHLDVENKRLLSTDGSALVSLPVELEADETSGPVSKEALQAANKAKSVVIANGALEVLDGPTFPRPSDDYTYPDVDRVIPEAGPPDISFNAKYLYNLARAMGGGKYEGVSLTFAKNADGSIDENSAIRVSAVGSDAIGVLMPMRV